MSKYIKAIKILTEINDKLDEVFYLFRDTIMDEEVYLKEAQNNIIRFMATLLYWLYIDGKIKLDESE